MTPEMIEEIAQHEREGGGEISVTANMEKQAKMKWLSIKIYFYTAGIFLLLCYFHWLSCLTSVCARTTVATSSLACLLHKGEGFGAAIERFEEISIESILQIVLPKSFLQRSSKNASRFYCQFTHTVGKMLEQA